MLGNKKLADAAMRGRGARFGRFCWDSASWVPQWALEIVIWPPRLIFSLCGANRRRHRGTQERASNRRRSCSCSRNRNRNFNKGRWLGTSPRRAASTDGRTQRGAEGWASWFAISGAKGRKRVMVEGVVYRGQSVDGGIRIDGVAQGTTAAAARGKVTERQGANRNGRGQGTLE